MFNDEFGRETRYENEDSQIFRYSRERRLKNAPDNVKEYYNGNFRMQKGIRVLFSNKANRVMLIALVVMTVFALIYSRMYSSGYKGSVAGYNAELTSFAFEERIYTSLKIGEKKAVAAQDKEPVKAEVLVRLYDVNKMVAVEETRTVLMEHEEEKFQITATDFDIVSAEAEIVVKGEKITIFTDVKR